MKLLSIIAPSNWRSTKSTKPLTKDKMGQALDLSHSANCLAASRLEDALHELLDARLHVSQRTH